jgi:hypothetical protein
MSSNFFNLPNPSNHARPWGLLSLYQKIVPETEKKMFLGSKTQLVHEADNLTAICEPIV